MPLPVPTADFTGKTVIVTGANTGLGLEAARHFTRLGAAKVILGCRSTEKAEIAKSNIESTTKTAGVVEVWPIDLASFESVKQFCKRAGTLERLDIVVANAAALSYGEFRTDEGYDTLVTVNVISNYLMALLLLPKLRQTAAQFNVQPNLSIVSSVAHIVVRI
jgi:NAD(P)-dependent dehydrogenase (short-subunit alcohol dehydrogenase family)